MAWAILVLAGLLEVGWAIGLKYSAGFTRLWPTLLTIAAMIVSMGLLGLAMNRLPAGTAYAVWTGIGAVGAFAVGIVALGEALTPGRLAAATLIVAGIALMKLTAPS